MDEYFLHYIWKFQKFNQSDLKLVDGQSLVVFNTGYHNHDSGPDFEEARIKIGDIEWAGHIEIHRVSSDWRRHKHSSNPAYKTVVLHVVWEHDEEVKITGETIPVLELKSLVDLSLLNKYQQHIQTNEKIACSNHLGKARALSLSTMLDRVLIERLEQKANVLLQQLTEKNNDWDAITYGALASNFGFSINKLSFIELAKRVPFSTIKKNINERLSIEALLFGQAGFLGEQKDAYQEQLKRQYVFLTKKHQLAAPIEKHQWKFGKMRPPNFPTIRIAQFASLLFHHPRLFSSLIGIDNPKEIVELFSFNLSPYWETHYDFGKPKKVLQAKMGRSTQENILINSIAPLLAAYSKYMEDHSYMNRSLDMLEHVKAEKNRLTKEWELIDVKPKSAFDSQAMIQLLSEYCQKRKCLSCNVGVDILNRS